MRILKEKEIKEAVFALAKENGTLPYGLGKKRFFNAITDYISLPDYCKLVVKVLKAKGVWMENLYKRMALCETNSKKREVKNGKRKRAKKKIVRA